MLITKLIRLIIETGSVTGIYSTICRRRRINATYIQLLSLCLALSSLLPSLVRLSLRRPPYSYPSCMLTPSLWCWIRECGLRVDGILILLQPIWASRQVSYGIPVPNQHNLKTHNEQKERYQQSRYRRRYSTMIVKWVKRMSVVVIRALYWS